MKKIIVVICGIIIISYVSIYYLSENKDTDINKQWYIDNDGICEEVSVDHDYCDIYSFKKDVDLNIKPIWKKKYKKQNEVVVAVIDTGIDFSHEDLVEVKWENKKEIPYDGVDNDNNGFVDDINGWNFCDNNNDLTSFKEEKYENDHGTLEAGIIAAKHNKIGIAGIAGNCNVKIMNVKILEGLQHEGSVENLIKGIKYAEDNGALICNLSLGFPFENDQLKKVMEESKMLFITSAGNDNTNLDKEKVYPACYDLDNQITVASLGFDGKKETNSNYGKYTVDVGAPGAYIYSTSTDGYDYESGTSMSAAMVSGISALIYAHTDNIEAVEVKKYICQNIEEKSEWADLVKTGGYVDAKKIINKAIKR